MSYSYVIGREVEEWAIGERWKFSRFTRTVWVDLAKEGRRLMPDPVAELLSVIDEVTARDAEILRKLQRQDDAEIELAKAEKRKPSLVAPRFQSLADALTERAYARKVAYLSAGSAELNAFLTSNEGMSYLFYLLLKPNHPTIDVDTAYFVYRDLSENNGRDGRLTPDKIIDICNGVPPEPAKNEPSPDSTK